MILWLLGLPFAFVVSLGYYSIIVCTVVGYGEPQKLVHLLDPTSFGLALKSKNHRSYKASSVAFRHSKSSFEFPICSKIDIWANSLEFPIASRDPFSPMKCYPELLGFETIGVEIENPFGRDYNDLPIDMVRLMTSLDKSS